MKVRTNEVYSNERETSIVAQSDFAQDGWMSAQAANTPTLDKRMNNAPAFTI